MALYRYVTNKQILTAPCGCTNLFWKESLGVFECVKHESFLVVKEDVQFNPEQVVSGSFAQSEK